MTASMTAPRTAEDLRRDEGLGRAELRECDDVDQAHDGAGGTPPPAPPAPRRRGYGGGRLPRWQQLLILGALVILAFVLGALIGGAIEHKARP